MLQLVQTRILSVVSWYHLAFFIISIAMFGLTAGAVWVYMRRDRFTEATLSHDLAYFTSAFGVGSTWSDTPLLPRLFIRTLLRHVYADKAAGEQAITRSTLDWTLVHPVGLTTGARTGRYRVGEHLDLRGFPTIARADLAEFLLTQIDDRSFIGKRVLVAS